MVEGVGGEEDGLGALCVLQVPCVSRQTPDSSVGQDNLRSGPGLFPMFLASFPPQPLSTGALPRFCPVRIAHTYLPVHLAKSCPFPEPGPSFLALCALVGGDPEEHNPVPIRETLLETRRPYKTANVLYMT
jgi:hypothetical protein